MPGIPLKWEGALYNVQYIQDVHCKDKMPKIWNKYSQKRNIGVSVPISTFMCLWGNYIFPRWVCLFCLRKYVDRSWEYINRSQTHESGNWGWGRAIPRKGIYKRNCCCSVVDLTHIYQNRIQISTSLSSKIITMIFIKRPPLRMCQPGNRFLGVDSWAS